VLDAVAEVRPPIILATLAVMVSFLPMFFITGNDGPLHAADGAQRAASRW
jgi:Cu/Ag efflux pump CusA